MAALLVIFTVDLAHTCDIIKIDVGCSHIGLKNPSNTSVKQTIIKFQPVWLECVEYIE